jgi:hypothetical protein
MRYGVLTPTRLLLVVVIVGAAAATLLGLAVTHSIPLTVSGLAVSGIALFVLGIMAAAGSVRAARRGAAALSVAAALFGGLCMLAAAGSLSVAIILGLLAASA